MLRTIFAGARKTGHLDLEAVEMLVRSAMHQAGAKALTELLRVPEPEQRSVPCRCGSPARYRELRSKTVFTVLGPAILSRPYFLCTNCHQGQFPTDADLDIVNTEFSPGVRRMQALVGQDASFDHGREQLELLAGLDLTTKSVERVAEATGADIARREQQEIDRALQLDLPLIVGEPVPILYVQMDGTGVPVVKKETAGRPGKLDGLPAHTRELKLGCVFTQTRWDQEGYAIRDTDSTTYTGAIETAEQFGKRLYVEAWKRGWSRAEKKWSSAMAPSGSGTSPKRTSPAPFKSSICFMPASTSGRWLACFIPPTSNAATPGSAFIRSAGADSDPWRSAFRTGVDHDSEVMPISIPN